LWDSANVAQFKTDYFGSSGAPHSAPGTYFYNQVFSGAPGTTVMSTIDGTPASQANDCAWKSITLTGVPSGSSARGAHRRCDLC
jgi:hypothetical protein